ncbi:MAG: hypothetical protein ACK4WD_04335 [Flavobacteriales bacterium]|jgi:hypothetical protein
MTYCRLRYGLFAFLALIISSCTLPEKFSYHPTTMFIPEAKEKGEVSAFGTMGFSHVEGQVAYAPLPKLVIQSATFIGGISTRSEKYTQRLGQKISQEFGIGYLLVPHHRHSIGIRGLWGYHHSNHRFYDPPAERCGNDFPGALDEFNYVFNSWSLQGDYAFKLNRAWFFVGVKLAQADYRHARMISVVGSDYSLNEVRENFSDRFLSTAFGVNIQITKEISFFSSYSFIQLLPGSKGGISHPSGAFTHNYRNELWSNGIAFTIQTRKKAK